MNISVVGTGYVGLVVGACLAETGNQVVGADIDERKIDGLKQNILPIYEPGLDRLVERNQAAGRLRFTTDVAGAIAASDVVFIAVGTPPDEDGSADLAPRARRRRHDRATHGARDRRRHQVDRAGRDGGEGGRGGAGERALSVSRRAAILNF